jgi:glycosyltransferase involved in cell wall biosynthesis
MSILLQLTTVHPRTDTRILIKESQSLAAEMPHKVILMVADGKGNVEYDQCKVSIIDLGRLAGNRLNRAFSGNWRAFVAVRKIAPDMVHFHDPELMLVGMILKLLGYKVVYDVHEDVPRQIHSKYYIPKIFRNPMALAAATLEWFCANFWDAIVPATPIIAKTPVIASRFPPSKTVVVNNFPINDELSVPCTTPYKERPNCFAYVGGIEIVRGIVEMITAFDSMDDTINATLELAGEINPSSLENEIKKLPGWSSVNYHGVVSREKVAQILNNAKAGLVVLHPVPTHIESYPIKMFEYMAVGLPIIASDFPVWREIINGAGCGILVDYQNPKAIADAMCWIIKNPTEAEAMGKRGREAMEREYSWNTEAAKLILLYKKLLSS